MTALRAGLTVSPVTCLVIISDKRLSRLQDHGAVRTTGSIEKLIRRVCHRTRYLRTFNVFHQLITQLPLPI